MSFAFSFWQQGKEYYLELIDILVSLGVNSNRLEGRQLYADNLLDRAHHKKSKYHYQIFHEYNALHW